MFKLVKLILINQTIMMQAIGVLLRNSNGKDTSAVHDVLIALDSAAETSLKTIQATKDM